MNKRKFIVSLFFMLFVVLFVGCNEVEYKESSENLNNIKLDVSVEPAFVQGRFIDESVRGLTYFCEDSQITGLSDTNGTFLCISDDNITFKLGKYQFKTLQFTNNLIVTPYTLFPDSFTSAINFARLLQSLDTHEVDGTITINKTLEAMIPNDINYSSATFAQKIESALQINLIDAHTAYLHLNTTLENEGITIPSYAITFPLQPPNILNSKITVDENVTSQSIIGYINIASIGDANITSILINGEDNTTFEVNEMGVVRVVTPLDYETKSKYLFEVTAINAIGQSEVKILEIDVKNIAEEIPILVDTRLSILENAKSGDIVGKLSIFSEGDTNISQITLNDSSTFRIDTDGTVYIQDGVVVDFEANQEYNLSVIATNLKGSSEPVSLHVYLNNFFDVTPILENTTMSTQENVTKQTYIGDISISNYGDSSISFIIEANDYFSVNNEGNITFSGDKKLDFETQPTLTLEVYAYNQAGKSNTISLVVNVTDVPEVANLQDTNLTLVENISIAQRVGDLNITYNGDSPITSISMSGEGSENFHINNQGVITVALGAMIDFETKKNYSFEVNATNGAGVSNNVILNIDVQDYPFEPFLIAKLGATSDESAEYFGSSVVVDGKYVVVGSPYEDNGGVVDSGSVYIFYKDENNTLTQVARFIPDDASTDGNFGLSVAMSGNYVVVGAKDAIYLLEINANTLLQRDKIDAPSDGDGFGEHIAMDSSYVVVGAMNEDSDATNSGKVYFYYVLSGELRTSTTLKLDNAQANDYFGCSVAVDGRYVVVGADMRDGDEVDSGVSYLYTIADDGTLSFLKTLQAPDGQEGDYFGSSVDISGNYVVVGAYKEDSIASNSGSAYLFNITNDSVRKFQAQNLHSGDYFGSSVSIDGDYSVIGAFGVDSDGINQGSSYSFKIQEDGSIVQISKLVESIGIDNSYFGSRVAMQKDSIVVATTQQKDARVYFFDTEPQDKIYLYNADEYTPSLDEGVKKALYRPDVAMPHKTLSYTLEGVDSAFFEINESKVVQNRLAFDYEQPQDSLNNNEYNITLRLSDNVIQKDVDLHFSVNNLIYLPLQNIKPSQIQEDDRFGYSVAKDGDYLVVSSPFDDSGATNSGALYLYKRGNDGSFTFLEKKVLDTPSNDDNLGLSVAISGNYIVAGSTTTQSVYLFKIQSDDTLIELKKIVADDSSDGDLFGKDIDISNNYIIIGASGYNNAEGAVYIYKIDNDDVTLVEKKQASDKAQNDSFGSSLSLDGEYFVVGSPTQDTTGTDAGEVYLFKIALDDTISEVDKIQSSDIESGDNFGVSVVVDGNVIVVGASYEDTTAQNAGKVYLFEIQVDDTLQESTMFQAQDSDKDRFFGANIVMSSDSLVISGVFDEVESLYLFQKQEDGSFRQTQKFLAPFTQDFVLDSSYIIGADSKDDKLQIDSGEVKIYKKD